MSQINPQQQKQRQQKSLSVKTHYQNLVNQNYTEEPVDIWKFLSDPNYLGIATSNGTVIFPIWKDALIKMFDDNTKLIVVLTGSIGTGKSTIALYALCYIQYRLMILREPWKFFELGDSGKMTISFFNLNRTLGDSRGYSKMMDFMSKSPWFRKNALHITPTKRGEVLEFKLIKYVLASPASVGFGVVGEDVVAGIMDEVDSPTDPEGQKKRVGDAYNATVKRFKSRFATTGYSLGKLFVVCSKQDESSFIDIFIAERFKDPEVLIFDIPYWDAKPKYLFCGKTFPIAVGDAYNPSRIIEEKDIVQYVENGFRIINPPVEFRRDFELDLIGSLRDVAGVTTAGTRQMKLFPSESFIIDCFDRTKEDPVKKETVETGLQDEVPLIKYIDITKFRLPFSTPRFIHYDISFTTDASGISMCGVRDWKYVETQNPDGSYRKELVPIIETDFVLRLKAFDGDRLPPHKVRKLVLDLRQAGINIRKFTADLQMAAEETLQLLKSVGIDTELISLDKTNKIYFDFRNLVFEKRWVCHRHSLLLTELSNLQMAPDGKVDHPDKILETKVLEDGSITEDKREGSKDISDSVAGSVATCLYSNERPMDVQLMSGLLKRGSLAPNPQNGTLAQEDINKILPMTDSSGNVIIGTADRENQIDKIQSIFRRLHGG